MAAYDKQWSQDLQSADNNLSVKQYGTQRQDDNTTLIWQKEENTFYLK